MGEEPGDLLAYAADNWLPEAWLAQLGWIHELGKERIELASPGK